MSPVFLDTVGMLALWDKADQWHEQATAAYEGLIRNATRFVTTSWIFIECGNAAARKSYRQDVNALRNTMNLRGELFEPTELEIEQAWSDYDKASAGTASIVDHVSFLVMRRLGLRRAFTNDAHFRTAGFETLF